MKTQIKTSLLIMVMMVVGLNAKAAKHERQVSVSVDNNKAVVLYMDNLSGVTEVTLTDRKGKKLFSEKTKSNFFGKVLDRESIGAGVMYLEIDTEEKLERLTLNVSESSASIVNKEILALKPLVKLNKDVAKVYFGGSGQKIEVALIQLNGVSHYTEEYQDDRVVARKFDLSNLEPGYYKFRFKMGNKYFFQTFRLK